MGIELFFYGIVLLALFGDTQSADRLGRHTTIGVGHVLDNGRLEGGASR